MHVLALDPDTRTDLVAHLARVRHDLGRYVVFQQRWVAENAGETERRDALTADLLATRRGPEGTVDAAALWADLRRPLVGEVPLIGGARVDLTGDPDLSRLDVAMVAVAGVIAALRGGGAVDLDAGARAAAEVAAACDAMWRRWRAGGS